MKPVARQKHLQERGGRSPLLMLIGWDGATPELLERFVAAGDNGIKRNEYGIFFSLAHDVGVDKHAGA